MPRHKKMVITGQKPTPDMDLMEIITSKRESKFSRYKTKESYNDFLRGLDHFQLCEELLRIGDVPSVEKTLCIERCLKKYDAAQKVRVKTVNKTNSSRTLESILTAK